MFSLIEIGLQPEGLLYISIVHWPLVNSERADLPQIYRQAVEIPAMHQGMATVLATVAVLAAVAGPSYQPYRSGPQVLRVNS
jgi:hypothetical protein